MARLTIFLFSLFLFFQFNPQFTYSQSDPIAEKSNPVKIERNLRAIKTYYSDEKVAFEGFMLCQKYTEKQKLLVEIQKSVKKIDEFARQAEFVTNQEIAQWRAKAHLLYGVAHGVIGEKKVSDFEVGIANEPLFAEVAKELPSYKEEEIRIGTKNQKLIDLERIQTEHLKDLATIRISIDPEKRNKIGLDLKIRMLTKPKVSHNEFVPFVLANAQEKLQSLMLKEGQRDLIYLPAGKYQISKTKENAIISQFEVKDLAKIHKVDLPTSKFPAKLLYLGAGLVALGALGFLVF